MKKTKEKHVGSENMEYEKQLTKKHVEKLRNLDFSNMREILQWLMDFSNNLNYYDEEIINDVLSIFKENGYLQDDINLKNRGKKNVGKSIIIQQLKYMEQFGFTNGNAISINFSKWKDKYGTLTERAKGVRRKISKLLWQAGL